MHTTTTYFQDSYVPASACREATLDEMLADPLTLALMKADNVEAPALEEMLRDVAGRIAVRPRIALRLETGVKAVPPLLDYRPWISAVRPDEPVVARSMHGAIKAKLSRSACGSPCAW